MQEKHKNIIKKDLLLIGAGHSHIEVLKYLANIKPKGLRITLVTNDTQSTYSGMVPGYIEGVYNWNQINIDIVKLCFNYKINLIVGQVTRISGKKKRVFLKNRPFLEFDILSINTGISSSSSKIIGAKKNALSLKPISGINKTINVLLKNKNKNIVIVGAGAAGVEVALALSQRFKSNNLKKNIILICKKDKILSDYPSSVSTKLKKELLKKKVEIIYNSVVTKVNKNNLVINNTKVITNCCSILATNAAAPDIYKKSDLTLSSKGFILVRNTLQTKSFSNIFASGDIADIENNSLKKAGVYAVKQAYTLKKNILKLYSKKSLINYHPQKTYLSLIGITNKNAIANKGIFTLKGNIIWKLKKFIDKKFINKYSFYRNETVSTQNNLSIEPNEHIMQCEGCGSKVSHDVLKNIFTENIKLGSYDANLIKGENGLVHTVDIITSIVDDLYLLGRLAAKHALNDLYASNSFPVSSQMILSVPKSINEIQKRDIYQITKGANSIFKEMNLAISGGHTYSNDSDKSTVGFSLIGRMNKNNNISTLNKNYKIFMTGKLGTALSMAALKQNKISGYFYEELINEMTKSNLNIFRMFKKNNIYNITDISGFGLLLHLKNLLIRNGKRLGANIYLDKILMLDGAKEAMKKNVISSLTYSNKDNILSSLKIINKKTEFLNILFDPQTAGGFVFITEKDNIIFKFKNSNINVSQIGEISNKHNQIRIL